MPRQKTHRQKTLLLAPTLLLVCGLNSWASNVSYYYGSTQPTFANSTSSALDLFYSQVSTVNTIYGASNPSLNVYSGSSQAGYTNYYGNSASSTYAAPKVVDIVTVPGVGAGNSNPYIANSPYANSTYASSPYAVSNSYGNNLAGGGSAAYNMWFGGGGSLQLDVVSLITTPTININAPAVPLSAPITQIINNPIPGIPMNSNPGAFLENPEPGTMVLMLSGLSLAIAFRKKLVRR